MKKILILLTSILLFQSSCSLLTPYNSYEIQEKRRKLILQNQAFDRLYQDVRYQGYDENRLSVLYSNNLRIFSNQAVHLLLTFSLDNARIEALKIILPRIIDTNNVYSLVNAFAYNDAKVQADNIIRRVYGNNGYTRQNIFSPTPPRWEHPYRGSCRDSDFQEFLSRVKNKPFDSERIELIRNRAIGQRFTCDQCVALMNIYTFDSDKLKVCEIIAPRLIDPENIEKIIANLSFLSSRDKLIQIVNRGNNNSRYNPRDSYRSIEVMPEADFNYLVTQMKKEYFASDKIRVLSNTIRNVGLTADQCIRLIKLFKWDDDQLSVCKIIAPNVADRQNIYKIIDSISWTSRDEARRIFRDFQ